MQPSVFFCHTSVVARSLQLYMPAFAAFPRLLRQTIEWPGVQASQRAGANRLLMTKADIMAAVNVFMTI